LVELFGAIYYSLQLLRGLVSLLRFDVILTLSLRSRIRIGLSHFRTKPLLWRLAPNDCCSGSRRSCLLLLLLLLLLLQPLFALIARLLLPTSSWALSRGRWLLSR
jgi:hypothetical protein